MADKLNLGSEVRELKLGPSFSSSKGSAFHTLRYDFKPASVDPRESATVDVGPGHEVTLTVPNAGGGAGTGGRTVFKGSHRPYQRECVLIIDKNTGEITLEKLTHNIQLKKTRAEQPSKASPAPRPATPTEKKPSPPRPQGRGGHSGGGKKAKGGGGPGALGRPLPKHSPLPASPSYPGKSPAPAPAAYKSPPQINMSPVGAAGSLPMIGLDDPPDVFPSLAPTPVHTERTAIPSGTVTMPSPYFGGPAVFEDEDRGAISRVGVLSASSSSSGSSDDSSDSDSDAPATRPALAPAHGRPPPAHKCPPTTNGHVNGNLPAADMLKADLELSESGSELD